VKAEGGKSISFLPVGLALGTGFLLFLTFPGAVGFWPLAWVALVPLLLAITRVSPGRAALLGVLAGMVHYVSLLYWIVIVLGRYGNLPGWVSVPALLLLALYMSSYLALFCGLTSKIWQGNEVLGVWVGPLLWVGLDYVRSFLFSGFPWQDLAYSQRSGRVFAVDEASSQLVVIDARLTRVQPGPGWGGFSTVKKWMRSRGSRAKRGTARLS